MSATHYSVTDNQRTIIHHTALRPRWLDEQLYPFQSRFVENESKVIVAMTDRPRAA